MQSHNANAFINRSSFSKRHSFPLLRESCVCMCEWVCNNLLCMSRCVNIDLCFFFPFFFQYQTKMTFNPFPRTQTRTHDNEKFNFKYCHASVNAFWAHFLRMWLYNRKNTISFSHYYALFQVETNGLTHVIIYWIVVSWTGRMISYWNQNRCLCDRTQMCAHSYDKQ